MCAQFAEKGGAYCVMTELDGDWLSHSEFLELGGACDALICYCHFWAADVLFCLIQLYTAYCSVYYLSWCLHSFAVSDVWVLATRPIHGNTYEWGSHNWVSPSLFLRGWVHWVGVVDSRPEASRAPVHELDSSFGFDVCDGGVDVFRIFRGLPHSRSRYMVHTP